MAEGIQLGANVIQGVMGYNEAQDQAQAMREQARYAEKITAINAKLSDAQAKEAIARGDEAASNLKSEVNKIVSSQKAGFAASGIDVSSGIADKLATETQILGEMDAVRIKNNAWKEAFGYKTDALSASLQNKIQSAAARNSADNTILTGGIKAATNISQGIYNFYKS